MSQLKRNEDGRAVNNMMKSKIAIGLLFTALTACTVSGFDNNEYNELIRTKVLLDRATNQCPNISSALASRLEEQVQIFKTYTQYRSRNEDVHNIALVISDNVEEFIHRAETDKMTVSYCITKTDFISFMIETGLETIDKKPIR